DMIQIENHLGTIEISQDYFAYLVGNAASSCYGVAGMVKSGARQGIRSLISRRTYADDGVRVRSQGDKLIIDLHICVIFGVNISAIAKSIVNKVRYTVEQATGLEVKKVNVFVDGMKTE
ncbi:MAG TPA: Asp23/Gls24 family envelope stress response protein, partial [Candidatus Avimonas sp.]|nr:Asp23/Gls24 family envelope stress response protein [Candidatus Avimonas sp.]